MYIMYYRCYAAPHDTTRALRIANKDEKLRFFKSSDDINENANGSYRGFKSGKNKSLKNTVFLKNLTIQSTQRVE